MKTATYNIRMSNKDGDVKTQKVDGYIIKVGKYVFGVDKRWPKSNTWVVTEIATGLQVGHQIKRLKDAEDEINKYMDALNKIFPTIPQTYYVNNIDNFIRL